ncbi:MAG: hypothetical protein KME07_15240 [Pegethrix bostrychoides GSE-TBD4-15B]|jgi:hypothetical protein|uniref:Uncharacterized protein n=1 Tax=Pegethrix bostrychoides GSE-TBD4-15B TaxID=2839662 RepID=A0A951PBZ6_9CYAN|nr:hypothetical protein [Pegethrix bostrychoides GSE-TBD4-15B]
MGRIRDLVGQAIEAGYLSLAAEEQLRALLQVKNEPEEIMAFMRLQQAAMTGRVRQESRELIERLSS